MNIAQSPDNTFAITDLTLKELTLILHIFNKQRHLSLDEYVADIEPLTPSGGGYDISASVWNRIMPDKVKILLETVQPNELIYMDGDMYTLINDFLSEGLVDQQDDGFQQAIQTAVQQGSKKKGKKQRKTKTIPAIDQNSYTPEELDQMVQDWVDQHGGFSADQYGWIERLLQPDTSKRGKKYNK